MDRCLRSWPAATPVKYERDIKHMNSVLIVFRNGENKRAEEIGEVAPTLAAGGVSLITAVWPKLCGAGVTGTDATGRIARWSN